MFQPTHDADAASILFNLPGYRVLAAVRSEGHREVLVEAIADEGACPDCGVVSSRVQARPVQTVKDLECGGEPVVLRVRKRRYLCTEELCARRTFTEVTEQLPARARLTTRLAGRVIAQLRGEPRAVSAVAAEHDLSWPTVMGLLAGTVDLAGADPRRLVRRLGVDEHRFRRVRYVRQDDGSVRRVEPWSVMLTDLDTGCPGAVSTPGTLTRSPPGR